jgi:endonuclease G, mitochondrial
MARIDPQTQKANAQPGLMQAAKEAVEKQKVQDKTLKSEPSVESRLAATDSPDRIAFRLDLISRNDPKALERLIGKRNIVSVNFFARGLQTAKAVCRIKTLGLVAGPPDYATGFLITPNLLITNNHVLPDPETASRSLAEFDYPLDANFVETRGRIFPFVPSEAFYTSVDLDFTIVGISPMGHDGTPIADFGVLPLIPVSGKGLINEHVSIIQHPQGGTKQVVVRENRIIELDKTKFPNLNPAFMHYTADTEPGSSGSPIFNDQWDVVAIHHQAIGDRDDQDRPLNKQGEIWTEDQGEDARMWIANEGIRISALWERVKTVAPFNADAAKIMAMLAYEPRAGQRPRPPAPSRHRRNGRPCPTFPTLQPSNPRASRIARLPIPSATMQSSWGRIWPCRYRRRAAASGGHWQSTTPTTRRCSITHISASPCMPSGVSPPGPL